MDAASLLGAFLYSRIAHRAQKSVTPKIAVDSAKAVFSEAASFTSAVMSSTPLSAQAWLAGLLGSRVIPRMCQPPSFVKMSATEALFFVVG